MWEIAKRSQERKRNDQQNLEGACWLSRSQKRRKTRHQVLETKINAQAQCREVKTVEKAGEVVASVSLQLY